MNESMEPQTRYARLPADILHSAALSPIDRLVYAELALWAIGGDRTTRGRRGIAAHIGVSPESVNKAIRNLEAAGHIVTLSIGKERGMYRLTSPLFNRQAEPMARARARTGRHDVADTSDAVRGEKRRQGAISRLAGFFSKRSKQ